MPLDSSSTLMCRLPRFSLIVVLLILVCLYALVRYTLPKSNVPHPPDLRECTRVEIRILPSVFLKLGLVRDMKGILSHEELEYLETKDWMTITDTNIIEDFAEFLRKTRYAEPEKTRGRRVPGSYGVSYFRCYHQNDLIAEFEITGETEVYAYGHIFNYRKNFDIVGRLLPDIQRFSLRRKCCGNLGALKASFDYFYENSREYPIPSEWCDKIIEIYRTRWTGVADGRQRLQCPAVGTGTCNYAMNPNCEPDSPPDTVLFFEAKPGWNQYGGPELIVFDNHDPKGACALLNDGTVKFVRTEEEIHLLRWK